MSWIWQAQGGGSGGGGRVPRVSALQPLNFPGNIVAAYALNEAAAACNTDRSGQGRNFVTAGQLASEMGNVPDLIPTKQAILGMSLVNGVYATQPIKCEQFGAYWQQQGELTVTFRYWLTGVLGGQTYSPVYCNATPTGTSSVAFQVAVTPTGFLAYYAEALKVGQLFTSTLPVPANQWAFLSCRRRASGTVRLGVGVGPSSADQTYQDSGPLLLPNSTVAGPTWFCRFGHNSDSAPVQPGGGPMADFVCWNRFFTDAELLAQASVAMAGAFGP